MVTEQSQVKVNLPQPLKEYLESRASKFGMPLSGYIKHLILKDVSEMDYPAYQASNYAEKSYEKAKDDERSGRLVKVADLEKFLNDL
jgi:predicted DNA-binding protein